MLPTIKKIKPLINDRLGTDFCQQTLLKIIKNLGFRWVKSVDNRKVLMERHDIRLLRINFLRKMRRYRREGRSIVYTDETYITAGHTKEKGWSDDSNRGAKKPIGKGNRLIIVHAGGEMGFIPNACLIFTSGQKSGDYHDDMNFDNYSRWMREKLLPNLPPNSVIVVDNASYHNVQLNPAPTSSSRKLEMQLWLRERNIQFEPDMLKPQLYDIIKHNKDKHKTFAIDEMVERLGHVILRLPPYHPDLNPIEKIWALLKEDVASKNVTFKLRDAERLALTKLDEITVEEWRRRCERAKRFEADFIQKDAVMDELEDRFIIRLGDDSSSDDEDSDDSSDEESFDARDAVARPLCDSDEEDIDEPDAVAGPSGVVMMSRAGSSTEAMIQIEDAIIEIEGVSYLSSEDET